MAHHVGQRMLRVVGHWVEGVIHLDLTSKRQYVDDDDVVQHVWKIESVELNEKRRKWLVRRYF